MPTAAATKSECALWQKKRESARTREETTPQVYSSTLESWDNKKQQKDSVDKDNPGRDHLPLYTPPSRSLVYKYTSGHFFISAYRGLDARLKRMTTHLIPLPDIEGWIVWVGIMILLAQTLPQTRHARTSRGRYIP